MVDAGSPHKQVAACGKGRETQDSMVVAFPVGKPWLTSGSLRFCSHPTGESSVTFNCRGAGEAARACARKVRMDSGRSGEAAVVCLIGLDV